MNKHVRHPYLFAGKIVHLAKEVYLYAAEAYTQDLGLRNSSIMQQKMKYVIIM